MSYPNSPRIVKGALIKFKTGELIPVPQVILFQYNPEKMTRTITPAHEACDCVTWPKTGTAQPFDPEESINVVLDLDATDALAAPESHPVAVIAGVADRIAALEMLLYPQYGSAIRELLLTGMLSSDEPTPLPRGTTPVVLFVWGPGRIVPIRLTSFSVAEEAYSATLYPIHAKVTIDFTVLTPAAFADAKKKRPLSAAEELAVGAYRFTFKQKRLLADANVANNVESVLGVLPF